MHIVHWWPIITIFVFLALGLHAVGFVSSQGPHSGKPCATLLTNAWVRYPTALILLLLVLLRLVCVSFPCRGCTQPIFGGLIEPNNAKVNSAGDPQTVQMKCRQQGHRSSGVLNLYVVAMSSALPSPTHTSSSLAMDANGFGYFPDLHFRIRLAES